MSIEIQVVDDPAQVCADALTAAAATGEHVVLTGRSTPKHAYELAAARKPAGRGRAQSCGSPTTAASRPTTICPTSSWSRSRCSSRSSAPGWRSSSAGASSVSAAMRRARSSTSASSSTSAVGRARFASSWSCSGVGADGHICSMFPRPGVAGRALAVCRRAFPRLALEPFVPRVTLTFTALSHAKRVLVLATGASKADPIAAAFADDAPHTTGRAGLAAV